MSTFVMSFLPRSKRLLISWLQSLFTVILEPLKIKSVTVFIFFPIYLPWSDGTGCHDLIFWMLRIIYLTPNSSSPTKPAPSAIFPFSVNDNPILPLVKIPNLECSLTPYSHVLHPIYKQTLTLPAKYFQNATISLWLHHSHLQSHYHLWSEPLR